MSGTTGKGKGGGRKPLEPPRAKKADRAKVNPALALQRRRELAQHYRARYRVGHGRGR
ncbi:hypothetical protein HRbin39_00966 [bacterium HR39]|nr:hypothetical protein HRbin39_00966 [bacterium HR39]